MSPITGFLYKLKEIIDNFILNSYLFLLFALKQAENYVFYAFLIVFITIIEQ